MSSTPALPCTGFARQQQFLPYLGIGRTTLHRRLKDGTFPQPVRPSPFGPSVTVWRWEDIHAFIRGEWTPTVEQKC